MRLWSLALAATAVTSSSFPVIRKLNVTRWMLFILFIFLAGFRIKLNSNKESNIYCAIIHLFLDFNLFSKIISLGSCVQREYIAPRPIQIPKKGKRIYISHEYRILLILWLMDARQHLRTNAVSIPKHNLPVYVILSFPRRMSFRNVLEAWRNKITFLFSIAVDLNLHPISSSD